MNHHSVARVLLGWVAIGLVLGSACTCGGLKVKSNGDVDAAPDALGVYDCFYQPPQPIPGTCCFNPTTLDPVSPTTPCVLASPLWPSVLNDVAVYVDRNLVPRDAANGWDYDATTSTVVLFGTYCDTVVAEGPNASVLFICNCGGEAHHACIP